MTKDELLAQAAQILEQEGWLVERMAREAVSHRLDSFAERYRLWQQEVDAYRALNPDAWLAPPDNS